MGEDITESPPHDIEPYEILELSKTATGAEIRASYRKLALQHHPERKDTAHALFQQVAFAYAILSDETRRRRYDQTGSTAETLDEDDNFDWIDFFRAQWKDTVTSKTVEDFKQKYQGSEDETRDVLEAFEKTKGDMNLLFQEVMLSNAMDDETRFRGIIDEAITSGKASKFDKYSNEAAKSRTQRLKRARKEAAEAEAHLAELGATDKANGDTDGLAAIIQQRQQNRAKTFLDDLEAKYAPAKAKTGKKSKISAADPRPVKRSRR